MEVLWSLVHEETGGGSYKGTIASLFQNAGTNSVVTLNIEDMSFFSNVVEPAKTAGNIVCEEVDGGFQLKLKAMI